MVSDRSRSSTKQLDCLCVLIDEVLSARSVSIDGAELKTLRYAVDDASFREVKEACQALATRGFHFRKRNDCIAAGEFAGLKAKLAKSFSCQTGSWQKQEIQNEPVFYFSSSKSLD